MILRPGGQGPFVTVYCSFCELPVEWMAIMGGRQRHDRLVVSELQSAYNVEIEAACCGRTQGIRIGLDMLMRAKASNQKIWAVVKKGRFQGIGALRRADVAPIRRKKKKAA